MLNWPHNALRNLWRLAWLKAAGSAAYMITYFHFYFELLRVPAGDVTVFPLTSIDRALPFQPWAFWPYISLWVYVCLPAALQPTLATLLRHGAAAAGLCFAGIGSYYFLPSTFVHEGPAWPVGHVGAFLGQVDLAHNVFPSMHVAFGLLRRGLAAVRADDPRRGARMACRQRTVVHAHRVLDTGDSAAHRVGCRRRHAAGPLVGPGHRRLGPATTR